MKKLFVYLSLALFIFASCSKENKAKILQSIPESSSMLVLVDLEKINHDLGNEQQSDGTLKLGSEFSQSLNSLGPQGKEVKDFLTENNFKFDFSYLAVFENKNRPVITFYVKNGEDFIKESEKTLNIQLKKSGKIWIDSQRTAAVMDNQVWLIIPGSGVESLSDDEILGYAEMKKEKSILSVDYVNKMAGNDADIDAIINLNKYFELMGMQGMMSKMALASAFEGAEYVTLTAKFEDAKLSATVNVLNNKFKPAPMALQLVDISPAQLSKYPGKGNFFYAFNIDPKSIESLLGQYAAMLSMSADGGNEIINALRQLDGTIIGSVNFNDVNKVPSFGMMVMFKDSQAASSVASLIRTALGNEASVTVDGNNVLVSNGQPEGDPISSVVSDFKGTLGGFIFTSSFFKALESQFGKVPFTQFSMLSKKDGGNGVQGDLTLSSSDKRNILLTILDFMIDMNNRFPAASDDFYDGPEEVVEMIEGIEDYGDPDDDVSIEELVDEVLVDEVN